MGRRLFFVCLLFPIWVAFKRIVHNQRLHTTIIREYTYLPAVNTTWGHNLCNNDIEYICVYHGSHVRVHVSLDSGSNSFEMPDYNNVRRMWVAKGHIEKLCLVIG